MHRRPGHWLGAVLPLVVASLVVACDASNMVDSASARPGTAVAPETVSFSNGPLDLSGLLYKPSGEGPFPVVLFNHGSAGGLVNNEAFEAMAPIFTENGWAFFAPYRRGQGLSEAAGPYIMDEIAAARRRGGPTAADALLTRLLSTEHLSDQLAALAWLRKQAFAKSDAIAVMGNSFGGIQALLGAANANYCAAVDMAGGAESWGEAPLLRALMTQAASAVTEPVMFLQAENDYSVVPSRTLAKVREQSGLPTELRIYPAFGRSERDGHSFPYRGVSIWKADVLRFFNAYCSSELQ